MFQTSIFQVIRAWPNSLRYAVAVHLFAEVLDNAEQGVWLYRFAHNCFGASFLGLRRNVGAAGHDHDRNIVKKRVFDSLGEKSPTVEYRHHQVQKNQARTSSSTVDQTNRFTSIRSRQDIMALKRQNFREQLAGFTIILDDQNHETISSENLTPHVKVEQNLCQPHQQSSRAFCVKSHAIADADEENLSQFSQRSPVSRLPAIVKKQLLVSFSDSEKTT